MNFKQGLAVALVQSLVTILAAGILFAYTWGKAEQKLTSRSVTVKDHSERSIYLEWNLD